MKTEVRKFKHSHTLEGKTSVHDGELVLIYQPFGITMVVVGFGGENHYTLHGTGGNATSAILVTQDVDSPIKIETCLGMDRDLKDIMCDFETMPEGLLEAAQQALADIDAAITAQQ